MILKFSVSIVTVSLILFIAVMYGTAFVGICMILILKYTTKTPTKICGVTLLCVFMLVMGFNRVYVGVHTPTDVVAGYSAGIFAIFSSVLILQKFGFLDISNAA